jgi:hypothetical protein
LFSGEWCGRQCRRQRRTLSAQACGDLPFLYQVGDGSLLNIWSPTAGMNMKESAGYTALSWAVADGDPVYREIEDVLQQFGASE